MANIGRKIRKIRELRDFTQEHMAHQLNLTQNAYSRIESGTTKLTTDRLRQIAHILEVDPALLLNVDEKIFIQKIVNNYNQAISTEPITIINQGLPEDQKGLLEQRIRRMEEQILAMSEMLTQYVNGNKKG